MAKTPDQKTLRIVFAVWIVVSWLVGFACGLVFMGVRHG